MRKNVRKSRRLGNSPRRKMLALATRNVIGLLFFIFSLCQVSQGSKPQITPNVDEIIKNEGDPLEIVCTGYQEINFYYPIDDDDTIVTSNPKTEESKINGMHTFVFQRPNTVHGDTGWYACANNDVEITSDRYNDPDINWIYVYVRSNSSFFVQADTIAPIREVAGGNIIIPCRPTSPDYNVILSYDDNNITESEKVSFDPKIGFTLKYLSPKDSGYYGCLINWDNLIQEVTYHLHVLRKQVLNEPKIIEDPLRHVTRGQTLYVNCTVDIDADIQYVFNWTTPQQSSRITSRQFSIVYGANTRRAVCELMIRDVRDEDEGEYVCSITSYQDSKKTSKNIKIYDPEIKYINLTSQDSKKHYERKYGDKVQWVVYVDAYPQPNLRWLNPKGDEILGSWAEPDRTKYAINMTPSLTILRINRLHVNDMGMYSLSAINEDKIETLNFTLDVLAKPIVFLESVESYYAPNQNTEMRCHVAAFPKPHIIWNFLKCPNYPSHQHSTTVELKNTTESSATISTLSKVNMTIDVSGQLNCTACNSFGCDTATENIFVSDGNGGFGVIEPKEPITKGDNIEIICAASVYNYTSNVEWLDDFDKPIPKNDRLQIIHWRTPFTYRSTLKINNVSNEDVKCYVCNGNSTDGIVERIEYNLTVHDPAVPRFILTNMKDTDLNVDLSTQGHKTIILKCFASGMPPPNVTWYKDGKLLNNNEQYLLLFKRQELHIKYLLQPDSGKFMCRAENRLGRSEKYQQITIKEKELPKGLIILIVILLIIVIILTVFFTIKVRREKKMRKELMEAGLMHFEEGALECLNPDLTVDDQAELLPYDKKWEFPRERLKLGKQLGSGAFGVVMKAEAQGICDNEPVTTVAVKMVRRTTVPTYVRALASELKIMVHLGKHLNVVNLLGACTKNISKRELLVIVEYCRFGNLHNYLLRHRANFINQIDPTTFKFDPTIGLELLTRTLSISSNNRIKYAALSFSRSLSANSGTDTTLHGYDNATDSQGISMSPDGYMFHNSSSQPGWRSNYRGDYKDQNLKPICTQDLLSWAFQVARGMEYLSQRKVLHGDLAARNILLAEDNIVKICDFGLAKTMYKDDNYKKKGSGPLPIKWMAIESIRDRVFSTQSDIWSFGIVLWEFFTLAETPYPGMEAEKQYQKLIEGYRMEKPEYATSEVYDIMLQCWKSKPTLRPSFSELVISIGDLLEENLKAHYVSLNTPYMDMNTMILENGKSDYLTMMSAPDHAALSSPTHEYVNSPISKNSDSAYLCMSPSNHANESGIFSPRPIDGNTRFDFPSPTSDSEEVAELSPMLKSEEDPYLKPINVQERRAEFARQRQSMKNQAIDRPIERDPGYCNAPRNLHLINLHDHDPTTDITEQQQEEENDVVSTKKDFAPSIIRTQDNYVNMPKQKDDLRKNMPDGFSNPSYIMVGNQELN